MAPSAQDHPSDPFCPGQRGGGNTRPQEPHSPFLQDSPIPTLLLKILCTHLPCHPTWVYMHEFPDPRAAVVQDCSLLLSQTTSLYLYFLSPIQLRSSFSGCLASSQDQPTTDVQHIGSSSKFNLCQKQLRLLFQVAELPTSG